MQPSETITFGVMTLLAIMLIRHFLRSKQRIIINQPKQLCIGRHKWHKVNDGAYHKVLSRTELNGRKYIVTQFWYRYICINCGALSEEASVLDPELKEDRA